MSTEPHVENLTPAEEQVQTLVREGLTNQQIARTLGISRDAVRYHLKSLHGKLATQGDRAELKRRGWLPLLFGGTALKVGGSLAGIGAISALTAVAYVGLQQTDAAEDERSFCFGELAPADSNGSSELIRENCFATTEEADAFAESVGLQYCITATRCFDNQKDAALAAGHQQATAAPTREPQEPSNGVPVPTPAE